MPHHRSSSEDSTQEGSWETQSSHEELDKKQPKKKKTYETKFQELASDVSKICIGSYGMRIVGERKDKKPKRSASLGVTRDRGRRTPPRSASAGHPPLDVDSDYDNLSESASDQKKKKKKTPKKKCIVVDNHGHRLKDDASWSSVGPSSSPHLSHQEDSDSELAEKKKRKQKGQKKNAKGKETKGETKKKSGKEKVKK